MKAIIFDLDGVLVHTDQYHYQAWKSLADELNLPFDEKKNDRLRGISRMESLEIVLEDSDKTYTNEEKEHMAEKKNEIYRRLLSQMTPQDVKTEVREALSQLKNMGYLLAVGSSSKNAKYILERTALTEYFDAISDGNGLQHSKPNPEVFFEGSRYAVGETGTLLCGRRCRGWYTGRKSSRNGGNCNRQCREM